MHVLLLLLLWQPLPAFRLPPPNSVASIDLDEFNESWLEEWEAGDAHLELLASSSSKRYPDGWFVPRSRGKLAYYDVHIPKCAGTSWANDVRKMLPPGVGYHSREVCYAYPAEHYPEDKIVDPMQPGDEVVLMLRRPAAHVYSQFLECKYSLFGRTMQANRPEGRAHLRNFTTWLRHFKGGAEEDDMNCYHPFNMQVRSLSCQSKEKFPGHHHSNLRPPSLATALHNVESAFFVGLVEHYQASLCLFYAKARPSEALPRHCECRDKKAWASFQPVHYAHDVPRHSLANITHEQSNLIKELTLLDVELYRSVQERFVREAAELLNATGTQILCNDS